MLTITSEHPSSENHFERKFQAKIYPSDQSFEKTQEELIEFKEKYHDEPINILSKLNTYSHFWNFIFWRLPWDQTQGQVWSIWSNFRTTRKTIDGFHRITALRIETYWGRTGYYQLKNTVPLRRYWSDKWNISQSSITIPYFKTSTSFDENFTILIWTA